MSRKVDIDILAFAVRIAIADQQAKAQHRKIEGAVDLENGCHARISRLRKELAVLDEQGAVEAA